MLAAGPVFGDIEVSKAGLGHAALTNPSHSD